MLNGEATAGKNKNKALFHLYLDVNSIHNLKAAQVAKILLKILLQILLKILLLLRE